MMVLYPLLRKKFSSTQVFHLSLVLALCGYATLLVLSLIHILLAATALEAGLQPVFECTGALIVDGQIFRCAGEVPLGQVDLAAALEKSCRCV